MCKTQHLKQLQTPFPLLKKCSLQRKVSIQIANIHFKIIKNELLRFSFLARVSVNFDRITQVFLCWL
jgi:hypothetical protein